MGTLYKIGSVQNEPPPFRPKIIVVALAGVAALLVASLAGLATIVFREQPRTPQAVRPQSTLSGMAAQQPSPGFTPFQQDPFGTTRPDVPSSSPQPVPAHVPATAPPARPPVAPPKSAATPQDIPPATGYGLPSIPPTPSGPTPAQVATRQFLTAVRATLSEYVIGKAEYDIATSKLDTIQQLGQLPGPEMEAAFAGQRSGLAKQKAAAERMVQLAKDQTVAPALRDQALAIALDVQRRNVSAQDGITALDRMLGQVNAPPSRVAPTDPIGFQPRVTPQPQGRARLGNANIRVVNDGRGHEQAIGRVLIVNEGPYDITDFRLSLKVNGLAYVLAPYEGSVTYPRPVLSRRIRPGQSLDVPVMTTGSYSSYSVYGSKSIILDASIDGPPGVVSAEAEVM